MADKVNPEMVILGREAIGLTQIDVSRELGITQSAVSRYESGLIDVPTEHVDALAILFRRPTSFFYWSESLYSASCLYHRKRSRIPVGELRRIHAQVNLLRIQATRLLQYTEIESKYSFHRLDLRKCGSAAEAARKMRHLWQLPTGPVRSVVGSIERAGGIVFRCAFQSVKVDGISQWPLDTPDLPPIFFVNEDVPGDRQRLTLAHEIGHVVLHHLPSDDPEREASAFAGEFLLPADEVMHEFTELTLQKAAALKSYWRVSMQAIVYRAHQLGRITEDHYQRLFRELNMKGYRTCEPVPIPAEEPQVLREMIRTHRAAANPSIAQLSEHMGMIEEEFREEYWHDLSGLRLVV